MVEVRLPSPQTGQHWPCVSTCQCLVRRANLVDQQQKEKKNAYWNEDSVVTRERTGHLCACRPAVMTDAMGAVVHLPTITVVVGEVASSQTLAAAVAAAAAAADGK